MRCCILTGFDLPMAELRRSPVALRAPGHPEHGLTPGVETTTGPLGQGFANAVGMAMAERVLAADFNRPGFDIVDHHTYVFMGDGCMMEGVSHEAAALAGTLGLGKLIAIYDDNGISIDSEKSTIEHWFTDDTPKRFEAYHWNVIRGVDGHNFEAIDAAVRAAKAVTDRPSLICCKTVIGKGAPNKANTGRRIGSALGEKEVAATRATSAGNTRPSRSPGRVCRLGCEGARQEDGSEWELTSQPLRAAVSGTGPGVPAAHGWRVAGRLARARRCFLAGVTGKAETIASRKASQNAIEGLARAAGAHRRLGRLGSLQSTLWSGAKPMTRGGAGNYVFYGVREFGMSAIMNGLTLHGGVIAFGGTFLTFSDYARNALRIAALAKTGSIFVYTHDSIGLGEDGPTHQPTRARGNPALYSGDGSMASLDTDRNHSRLDRRHRTPGRTHIAPPVAPEPAVPATQCRARDDSAWRLRVVRGGGRVAQGDSDCHRFGGGTRRRCAKETAV
jgi:transketolase